MLANIQKILPIFSANYQDILVCGLIMVSAIIVAIGLLKPLLFNKIKNHATSKIFKVKGKEGKFGSQFFSGGYGGNTLNRTLPGVNSYRGQANPRFGSLDMDSGYLVRNYDSMPWAYQDAMRRESKKRTKSNKYFDI